MACVFNGFDCNFQACDSLLSFKPAIIDSQVILLNTRSNQERDFTNPSGFDIVSKSEYVCNKEQLAGNRGKLPQDKVKEIRGTKITGPKGQEKTGTDYASITFNNKIITSCYKKPFNLPVKDQRILINQISKKLKNEILIGDINWSTILKASNNETEEDTKYIQNMNAIDKDIQTFETSTKCAHTEFVDKRICDLIGYSNVFYRGFDHVIVTGMKLKNSKAIGSWTLDMDSQYDAAKQGQFLNEIKNSCMKYVIKRQDLPASYQSFMNLLKNEQFTEVNKRIKVAKKMVTEQYDEKTRTSYKGEDLTDAIYMIFKRDFYNNTERKGEPKFPRNLSQLTAGQIRTILNDINTSKAAGPDNVPMKMAKRLLDLPDEIQILLNKLWTSDYISKLDIISKCSKLIALKKDNEEVSTTFRPILISPLWMKIAETRFKPILEEFTNNLNLNTYQSGFLKNNGTFKNIGIAVDGLLRGYHVVAVDCAKAYNSISWKAVDKMLDSDIMHSSNGEVLHKEERAFIKSLYKLQTVYHNGTYYKPLKGLAQGQILAPSLFILTMESAIRYASQKSGIRIKKIFKKYVLCYADDILIIAKTRKEIIMVWECLQLVLTEMGQEHSALKTVTFDPTLAQCLNINTPRSSQIKDALKKGKNPPKKIRKYIKYLGIYLTPGKQDFKNLVNNEIYNKQIPRTKRIRLHRNNRTKQQLVKSHILSKIRYSLQGEMLYSRRAYIKNKYLALVKQCFGLRKKVSQAATETCIHGDSELINAARMLNFDEDHPQNLKDKYAEWNNDHRVKHTRRRFKNIGTKDWISS